MGIKQLSTVIKKHAPQAITEMSPKSLAGKTVAIDASVSLYQFLNVHKTGGMNLKNHAGKETSHLSGLFYRTTRIASSGIKSSYVFDGKAPELKKETLRTRAERREASSGVAATWEHAEDARELLGLMGIPIVQAPSEAEAQCAELAREGVVDAVASVDLDTLPFGSPLLLRNLTGTDAQAKTIAQIHLGDVLTGLDLTMDQFIDLSLLLGCDYLPSLNGIGPVAAIKLLRKHGSIGGVLVALRENQALREQELADGKTGRKKTTGLGTVEVPLDWRWKEAKGLFLKPEVIKAGEVELKWRAPDRQGLQNFLVRKHNFDSKRIDTATAKLQKAYGRQS